MVPFLFLFFFSISFCIFIFFHVQFFIRITLKHTLHNTLFPIIFTPKPSDYTPIPSISLTPLLLVKWGEGPTQRNPCLLIGSSDGKLIINYYSRKLAANNIVGRETKNVENMPSPMTLVAVRSPCLSVLKQHSTLYSILFNDQKTQGFSGPW